MKTTNVLDWTNKEQKILMEQYEELRSSGVCNMFSRGDVNYCAKRMELNILKKASNNRNLYKSILMNFNKLMKKFNIRQN